MIHESSPTKQIQAIMQYQKNKILNPVDSRLPAKLLRVCLTALTGIVFLFPAFQVAAKASAQDVHEVADICMYSQRILKDYALVGMNITYHDPAADLVKNAKTIDKYLDELKSHHLKAELDDEIKELEGLWKEVEPLLLETPEKKKMTLLHKKVEALSHRCEQIAEDLAKDTGIEGEHDVVLLAELGMESQRLAALYMMKTWGIADDNYYEEVQEVLDDYEKIYHELMEADDKLVSPEIKERLKLTEKQFKAFKFMAASKSGRFVPTIAEKITSKIFKEVRELLKLEEQLVE